MKILVTSDSHGDSEVLQQLLLIEKCDYYFHCGDSCDNKDNIYPFVSVKGNCDHFEFDRVLILKINNFKFLITHGHMNDLMSLKYMAISNNINIVLTGHTHIPHEEIVDNVLFINPGSIARPRGSSKKTYCTIEFSDNENDINNILVTFKSIL